MKEITNKIEQMIKLYYDNKDSALYYKACERTFNEIENKESSISLFVDKLRKKYLLHPVISGPGNFPYYRFMFSVNESQTESVYKSTNLVFNISTLDDIYTYYFMDEWKFMEYKTFSLDDVNNADFPIELHRQPPSFNILYSERSLLHELNPNIFGIIKEFKSFLSDYLFIPHQPLFWIKYDGKIPYYAKSYIDVPSEKIPAFELIFDGSLRSKPYTILN